NSFCCKNKWTHIKLTVGRNDKLCTSIYFIVLIHSVDPCCHAQPFRLVEIILGIIAISIQLKVQAWDLNFRMTEFPAYAFLKSEIQCKSSVPNIKTVGSISAVMLHMLMQCRNFIRI